jgi:hypothetical protein
MITKLLHGVEPLQEGRYQRNELHANTDLVCQKSLTQASNRANEPGHSFGDDLSSVPCCHQMLCAGSPHRVISATPYLHQAELR